MDNIKQFLEADALRTQGEWFLTKYTNYTGFSVHPIDGGFGCIAERWEEGQKDVERIEQILSNGDFIAAASRIAPDLAKMVEDIRVAKEALETCRTYYDTSGYANEQKYDEDLIETALSSLKPYEKLFEKEGDE